MNREVITSTSNQRIKNISSLLKRADKRKRDNVYVVEGVRLVLDAPLDDIQNIYVSDKLLNKSSTRDSTKSPDGSDEDCDRIRHFLEECDNAGIDITVVSSDVIKRITDTVTPQGIVAVIRRHNNCTYQGRDTYLLLEDIQDPGNMGTLLRSAEAAGIDMVIMSKGCVDIYNPKTIRSTMGTIYRLPYLRCLDDSMWYKIIDELKDAGVRLYGGCLNDSTYYGDVDYSSRCGIVIGNEGSGISDATLNMIDKVHIPMKGGIESLNASVAGSILMYEINRHKR